MQYSFTKLREGQNGFSILEMLLATVILLVGLVAVAQLVPASILLNSHNRTDSAALVFAQRELDQMLDQPLTSPSFLDALGNTCQLGNSASLNVVQGSSVVVVNNQPLIVFGSPTPPLAPTNGYGFTYQDTTDPTGTTYDVRWAVIITGSTGNVSSKRFILGVQQLGGNGYYQPITLDTMVAR
jgi:prepilin-type N-terminal cleavage/methylation domain-containing protein